MALQASLEGGAISTIRNASPEDVKAVLISLCARSHEQAGEALILLKNLDRARAEREKSHAGNGAAPSVAGTKRKADVELAICGDCKTVFSPSEEKRQDNKDCGYHTGELEPDDEKFDQVDDDPDPHVDMYGDFYKSEYPDLFRWTCCNRSGDDTDGCVRNWHSVVRRAAIGGGAEGEERVDDLEDDEDEEDEDEGEEQEE